MAGSGITAIGGGGGGGGGVPYSDPTITNTAVGGVASGTNIGGLTPKDVQRNMLISYLFPAFSSFAIANQPTQLEVGQSIAQGAKTFNWGTTNNPNISGIVDALNMQIRDVTNNAILAASIANNGTQILNFASAVIRLTPGTQKYRITGKNTNLNIFTRDFDVSWNWRRFFGVAASAPSNSAEVRALSGITFGSSFTINIAQGQTIACFAYEDSRPDITDASVKYVEGFNSNVGATFTKFTRLVNEGAGNPIGYKVYIAILPAPYSANATYNVTIP